MARSTIFGFDGDCGDDDVVAVAAGGAVEDLPWSGRREQSEAQLTPPTQPLRALLLRNSFDLDGSTGTTHDERSLLLARPVGWGRASPSPPASEERAGPSRRRVVLFGEPLDVGASAKS